ncbi:MAG: DNA polymerase, partial [Rickettsiales bacterium]|nr:DNA polymerase [Rickettsiales bacterium]
MTHIIMTQATTARSEIIDNKPNHLVLIDGYGFVFRAYHSLPPLTRTDGTPIGAVLGFTNMLIKTLDDIDANHIAVILDAGSKTFRNDIYSDYKANRPPAPEDLIPQFPLVKEAAEALNLAVVDKVGFEADDLIATYAKLAKEQNYKVTIISSDKDLMQLVDDDVLMYDAMKNKRIDSEAVKEKFGVEPKKVLDVLSLMGDSSDNVPGVAGIGPKTAATLINEYGTLEHLLDNANLIKQNKRRETLIEQKDLALLSKQLITLNDAVEDIPSVETLAVKEKNAGQLIAFLRENEFKSILARVEKLNNIEPETLKEEPQAPSTEYNVVIIDSLDQLQKQVHHLKYASSVAFDVVVIEEAIQGIAFTSTLSDIYYIPLKAAHEVQSDLLSENTSNNTPYTSLNADAVFSIFKDILENPSCMKIVHDIKSLLHLLINFDITISPYDDVMSMSYVIDAAKHQHSLSEICQTYLPNLEAQELEQLIGKGKNTLSPEDLSLETISQYTCKRSAAIHQLSPILKKKMLEEQLITLYERLDKPLSAILAKMEHYGVLIDPKALNTLSYEFAGKLSLYEKEIFHLSGEEFNIGSPKQLGDILFDHLDLKIDGKLPKKSKTGAYSTNADVLEKLSAGGHEIADKILAWRGLSKLKS